MTTGVFELNNVCIASNDIFLTDCSFPIAVWNDCCDEVDDVMRNLPMRMGWWSQKATQPVIHSGYIELAPSNCAPAMEDCAPASCGFKPAPIARAFASNCMLKVPQMKLISAKSDIWNTTERIDEFCQMRSINSNSQWCVFDQNGQIITRNSAGVNKLAIDFERWNMQIPYTALVSEALRTFIHGDKANDNMIFNVSDGKEIDGLYSQLLTGWESVVGAECPDKWNTASTIDWSVLTGKVGCASPEDKTIAGVSITLSNGQVCPVPEGYNLPEFFEWIWLGRIVKAAKCKGGVDSWEMHVPEEFGKCFIKAATCIQPCGNCASFLNDPGMRDRYSNAIANNLVTLYPSGRTLPMMESNALNGKNEIWFGPRSVGGRPSYVAFWDDMSRYFSGLPTLNGTTGYGIAQNGYNPHNLIPQSELVNSKIATLEDMALHWEMHRFNHTTCLQGSFMGRIGMLACNRHLWLRVKNVCCPGACNETCQPKIVHNTSGVVTPANCVPGGLGIATLGAGV